MIGDLLRIVGLGHECCKHEAYSNPHPQSLVVWCHQCKQWIKKIG
uniref:Uncharacterized protein n=1 Tax=viral metagenome TaxID=1070528 RepID=A0A6M3KNT2_9ZZZZ